MKLVDQKHNKLLFWKSEWYKILVSIFFFFVGFEIYNIPLVDDIQSGYFAIDAWFDMS